MADSRSSLQHILAADPVEPAPAPAVQPPAPTSQPRDEQQEERKVDAGRMEESAITDAQPTDEPLHTSTTTSTRRNASGTVSSVYSGNKMRHLKKEDGVPLWRKDVQYEFLKLVFYDTTPAFTKFSDRSKGHTFAEVYIDAMAKSSKCSKILKEKLLQDQEGAISMAMVCLLVNVGRMNTTLNFFPEMRAQLRTYHSIPALQAHQDPNAYKQLQDAPRLKSILKGATEDDPQPGSMEEIKQAKVPRTNPVNLLFVMSQYAPKISEVHFTAPRDFFDLFMRSSLSSKSRAAAFLWLVWWYLESDFSYEDSQSNPFGPGQQPAEDDSGASGLPLKVPPFDTLTEEQAALENVDTEDEIHFGEVKRKERIAILASEPSPAMTALKRARREKGLVTGSAGHGVHVSDDESNDPGWWKMASPRTHAPSANSANGSAWNEQTGSELAKSPSPAASRGFQAVNAPSVKPAQDMNINALLNNDEPSEPSPPIQAAPAPVAVPPVKKGPGRGNWRRNKGKTSAPSSMTLDGSHHVPLLPNTPQYGFVNETPAHIQPATPGSAPYQHYNGHPAVVSPHGPLSFQAPTSTREHIPTPSYQAQKRNRGPTQHQSAMSSHRKQQVNYNLDRRIRNVHNNALDERETEGTMLRAWKRIRTMPPDYDSDEEAVKMRKVRERLEKEDDFQRDRSKGKENIDQIEEADFAKRPRVLMAGFAQVDTEANDVGEETRYMAKSMRRFSRRLDRWQELMPGAATVRRRQLQYQVRTYRRSEPARDLRFEEDGIEIVDDGPNARRNQRRSTGRSRTAKSGEHRAREMVMQPSPSGVLAEQDDDGGGELDEEDRELLGEVDADESGDDDDEDMDPRDDED